MNLVEAPGHARPAAPPHAPEQLRTLLAEGGDATKNDVETAQSEKRRKQKKSSLKFKLINFNLNPRIRSYFCPSGGRSGGAEVPPLCVVLYYSPFVVVV